MLSCSHVFMFSCYHVIMFHVITPHLIVELTEEKIIKKLTYYIVDPGTPRTRPLGQGIVDRWVLYVLEPQQNNELHDTHAAWYIILARHVVTRLSSGEQLLVNLLQVVKRTNTPLIPAQMASTTGRGFLGARGFESHHPPIINLSRLSHVELEKYSLSSVSPGNETAWILTRPPVHPADLLSRRFKGGVF